VTSATRARAAFPAARHHDPDEPISTAAADAAIIVNVSLA
jgi:hypothetical protein